MSHTNETPNFDLPQFTADDKPDWLVDINAAFLAIDTGMEATQSEAESASSTAQLAQETAADAAETAGQASSDVAGLTTDLETIQGTVNTVTALIGNGTPTTTDKTIIGAINELAAVVEAGSVSVTADGVKTRKQMLESLHALIDYSKLTEKSVLVYDGYAVYFMTTIGADNATFSRVRVGSPTLMIDEYTVAATASAYQGAVAANGSYARSDESETVIASGKVFKLIY